LKEEFWKKKQKCRQDKGHFWTVLSFFKSLLIKQTVGASPGVFSLKKIRVIAYAMRTKVEFKNREMKLETA
jgi:hypothetical protein